MVARFVLIDHDTPMSLPSDLRDWVDNVTIVRKKDGLSKVEGSLCA